MLHLQFSTPVGQNQHKNLEIIAISGTLKAQLQLSLLCDTKTQKNQFLMLDT